MLAGRRRAWSRSSTGPPRRASGRARRTAVGRPLAEVLALQDQEGRDWFSSNCPYDGLATRTAVPEQSVAAHRRHRGAGRGPHPPAGARPAGRPGRASSLRSGRGRARLDRERSDLVATVAHELRSPLTGVKGFVQALLNRWDKLNDEQKKLMLTTVHADSDRLSRLIAELLDVARIDTGRLQLYPRPCDAGGAGRPRSSSRCGPAPRRPIELDAADDLPEISADPDKFTQVVTNLVENAVRHGDGRCASRCARSARSADFAGRPDHRRRRGRRASPPEIRQAGLHQVLEARRARRLRPGACTSSTGWSAPTAAPLTDRRRARRRRPDRDRLARDDRRA